MPGQSPGVPGGQPCADIGVAQPIEIRRVDQATTTLQANPTRPKNAVVPSLRLMSESVPAIHRMFALLRSPNQEHPAANRFMKHMKSRTFSTGGRVLSSQLA